MRGWKHEPVRHGLSSRGIETTRKAKGGIDVGDKYYHVRQRDPDKYSKVRIPDWAQEVAQSVSKDAKVKMGKKEGSDDWEVQSVMITTKHHSKEEADDLANRIKKKIES